LSVVALENLFVLGWEKVGLVKRMVCGLFRVSMGAAAEGRVMDTGVAVGGAVEAWRYGKVRSVSLMVRKREGLIELERSRK
jgi:hypothetical protein